MRNDGGRDGERGIMFILFEIVVQTLLRVVLFLFFPVELCRAGLFRFGMSRSFRFATRVRNSATELTKSVLKKKEGVFGLRKS